MLGKTVYQWHRVFVPQLQRIYFAIIKMLCTMCQI